jgi:heptosyltransferase II
MEKILVIQTAFIGDAILTLPMIQKLKEIFTNSVIDVVAIDSTKEIFESSTAVNEVILFDKRGRDKGGRGLRKMGKVLKEKGYTRVYSPHRSFRTALLVLFSGIKNSTGFSNSSLKFIYKNIIKYSRSAHEVERNLALIGYKGDWRVLPEINFSTKTKEDVEKILGRDFLASNIAVIAPGSVWETKKYPVEYYIEIATELLKEGYKVIVSGSKNEGELCKFIENKFPGKEIKSTAGLLSLTDFYYLLTRAKILISNDSAPAHLGVAADIPVLTIFCSTIPDFGFYPYNKKSFYLSYEGLKCKPCGIHGHRKCPIDTFECAHKLDNQKVINKIKEMLNNE